MPKPSIFLSLDLAEALEQSFDGAFPYVLMEVSDWGAMCRVGADTLSDIRSLLTAIESGGPISAALAGSDECLDSTSPSTSSVTASARDDRNRSLVVHHSEATENAQIVSLGTPQHAVADRLLSSKHAREAKLEEMRREKEARELALLQPAPQINKSSRTLALKATGGRSITDRMADEEKAKVEKQKRLQLALQQRELAEVKGKPVINSSSKGLRRDVTAMMEWQQERERKIAEKLAAKQAAEAAELQPAPAISKRSEKLAEQFKRKHKQELLAAGPVQRNHRSKSSGPSLHRRANDDDDEDEDDCDDSHAVDDVGNRLYRTAALYKQKQEQRAKEEAKRNPHKPSLNPRSARFVASRDEPVSDRLYKQAEAQAAKRAVIQHAKQLVESRYEPETGREMFKPAINKKSAQIMSAKRHGTVNGRVIRHTTSGGSGTASRSRSLCESEGTGDGSRRLEEFDEFDIPDSFPDDLDSLSSSHDRLMSGLDHRASIADSSSSLMFNIRSILAAHDVPPIAHPPSVPPQAVPSPFPFVPGGGSHERAVVKPSLDASEPSSPSTDQVLAAVESATEFLKLATLPPPVPLPITRAQQASSSLPAKPHTIPAVVTSKPAGGVIVPSYAAKHSRSKAAVPPPPLPQPIVTSSSVVTASSVVAVSSPGVEARLHAEGLEFLKRWKSGVP